jgi:hypothetical protein
MKVIKTLWIVFIISLSALLLTLPYETTSFASHHEGDKTTTAEVKQEAAETYTVLKDYTIEQRDEAVAAADKKLKELDVRIEQMQKDLDSRWQDMSQAVRDKNREMMNKLNKEREVVAEWYGGLRHSSTAAWEDVKKGFADSYDRLDKAFQDAKKNFMKNN